MRKNGGGATSTTNEGRYIDLSLGSLLGEGSQQLIKTHEAHPEQDHQVWQQIPAHDGRMGEDPTYYDRPAIKEPVWIWSIPLYFYIGGAGAAAVVLGGAAQALAAGRLQGLIKRCRWLAALGINVGAFLLIYDLGRKERFLNMLRVFRPTSPMSIGSWAIMLAGGFSGLAALLDG